MTHETMTENLAIYRARGYVETARSPRSTGPSWQPSTARARTARSPGAGAPTSARTSRAAAPSRSGEARGHGLSRRAAAVKIVP